MVSGRDVIYQIFQCLDTATCRLQDTCFSSILELLVCFAQAEVISTLEIHQHLVRVVQTLSYENENQQRRNEEKIVDLIGS
jgi:hypothetical protein